MPAPRGRRARFPSGQPGRPPARARVRRTRVLQGRRARRRISRWRTSYVVPVVNDQLTAVPRFMPSAAAKEPSIRAVYDVLAARVPVGLSVTTLVEALYETVAATVAPVEVFLSVTVEPEIVLASMSREKVAVTAVPRAIPVAPAAGVFVVTVGCTGMTSIALIVGLSMFATVLMLRPLSVMTTPATVTS